jgi:4-hydroxyphenylpyruvate dioxygenase
VTAPAPGGGILYATWHAHFGPSTLADLEQIPGERILVVQVSDSPSERSTDHAWATRRHRLVPGEGAADPRSTIAALRATGCRSPLTVEVFNDEMVAELGPGPFAVRLHHSLQASFQAACPSQPTEVR